MAADTFSTDGVGVILMGTGNDNNTWGVNLNQSALQIIADAIANVLSSAVTGGTLDLSGSPPPAAPSQAHYAALKFTGNLGSAQTVKVPNLTKFWLVNNATTGAFTLSIQTPSGSASVIPQNAGWQVVFCDASNNIVVFPFNTKQIQMPDGSVSAPAYSDVNETNSGWYRAGTQDWRLSVNGGDLFQVTGAGASSASQTNVLGANALLSNTKTTLGGTLLINATTITPSGAANTAWYTGFAPSVSVGQIIDGAGSVVTTGQHGQIFIPFPMTISKWAIMADQSGSVTIDVLRANDAVPASSIVGGGTKPNLSSAQYSGRTTPSSWTATTLAANDWISFNITAATTVQRVSIVLIGTRTGQ